MLQLHNVSVRYGAKYILNDVSLALRPHRLTVMVGQNGSGKSTLLACVNQQIPYTGQIVEGEKNMALISLRERAKSLAILPQNLPSPHVTAYEMAAFGRNPYLDFTGRLTEKDKQIVTAALADVGASELGARYVDTLSGGEQQRVRLAMILAQNTPIALLDEPTSHMDQRSEATFLELLRDLKCRKKKTFLVVIHDLTLAAEYADDLIVLEEGRVVFSGTKEDCLEREIIEKTFGLKRYTVEGKVFFSAN